MLDPIVEVDFDGNTYKACLSIAACDALEAELRMSLEAAFYQLAVEKVLNRSLIAKVLFYGMAYDTDQEHVSYEKVRSFLHRKHESSFIDLQTNVHQLLTDAVLPPDAPSPPEEEEISDAAKE